MRPYDGDFHDDEVEVEVEDDARLCCVLDDRDQAELIGRIELPSWQPGLVIQMSDDEMRLDDLPF